jgi:hypothetical protein
VLPLHLIIAALFGWIEREQRDLIEFLREENRVLKAQLHGRRMRLSDDERRRLAVIGQRLGRRILAHVATVVTPDTILRWHRGLIARKWTSVRSRPGRPGGRRCRSPTTITWSRHSRRIDPISLSAYGFCDGLDGLDRISSTPMPETRRRNASP